MKIKHLDKFKAFAQKHDVTFEPAGEIGFGRSCTGFLAKETDCFIAFNPVYLQGSSLIYLKDVNGNYLSDDRFFETKPADAYHKGDYFAVLVHDDDYEKAYDQLSEWIDELEKMGVEVVDYQTQSLGIQAVFSGTMGKALRLTI